MNLTLNQKWTIINKFIEYKVKQNPGLLVIKQSQPVMGVWIGDSFFSIDQLINALQKKGMTK